MTRLHKVQARNTFDGCPFCFVCLCCRPLTSFVHISSIAVFAFTFLVSFKAWPPFLFAFFLAGALVALRHVPFCAHWITRSIRWVFKGVGIGFVCLFSRNKVVGYEEKENGKPIHQHLLRNVSLMTIILSCVHIVYTSTVRFSEGEFPHNTIIPNHDERPTSPKVSTVAPPYGPW